MTSRKKKPKKVKRKSHANVYGRKKAGLSKGTKQW